MSEVVSIAFWGAAAFCGGFAFTAWKKWVCVLLFVIGLIMMGVYASGTVAQALMMDGIETLWAVMNSFGACNPITTFFALITGLWFGAAYLSTRT